MAYGSEGPHYPGRESSRPPGQGDRGRPRRPDPYDPYQILARERAEQQNRARDGRPREQSADDHPYEAHEAQSYGPDADRGLGGRRRPAVQSHRRDADRDTNERTQRLDRYNTTRAIPSEEDWLQRGYSGLAGDDRDVAGREDRRYGDDGPEAGDGQDRPAGRSDRRRNRRVVSARVRRRRKIVWRSALAVFLIVAGYVGTTLYPYVTAPGTDTLSARVAEWGRDHHLSWAVTWLENATYKAPPVGGSLNPSQLAQLDGGPTASRPKTTAASADLPANISPLAVGTVRGEGVWHPVLTDAAGDPILERAALRPDAQHTSELAYVAWMNQKALTFSLRPGFNQPGGSWSTPDSIPPRQRAGLVATWNGGFKIKDALGGFYAQGRTAATLVNGKAAEVFYRDGSMKVGLWGRDETMTPQVAGVRQNLSLLVDRGQVAVGPGDGSSAQWGLTIKNSYFIARSGVGMTATGDIVYVGGQDLSVYTLAKLLQAAGAVDAMELDINPEWVSFMSYGGADKANPAPTKLWEFSQPADRYFQPSDRDFVAVYTR
jgi:hypothetical protein